MKIGSENDSVLLRLLRLFCGKSFFMNPDDFEHRLARLPVKEIPGEWRADILSAARAAQPAPHASRLTPHGWLSTLNSQLSSFFWPHPKAWAGLAAVWVCIVALNFSTRDKSVMMAEKVSPPSAEVIVELRKQQKLYAELMGSNEPREADRPKDGTLRPRTQRVEILTG